MTTENIFSTVNARMTEGVMVHSKLACLFIWLGFPEFAEEHMCHMREEATNLVCLNQYYSANYDALIPESDVTAEKVIPDALYSVSSFDIKDEQLKDAVKNAFLTWTEWEYATKKQLELYSTTLRENGETLAACYLETMGKMVEMELEDAETKRRKLEMCGYDLTYLVQIGCEKEKGLHYGD